MPFLKLIINKKILHTLSFVIGISLWVFLFLHIISPISYVERISHIINDRFTFRSQYSENKHTQDIVIIKIDDTTLDAIWKSDLGMMAFDKGVYADFIDTLMTRYKAEVIGIDIVFANPSALWLPDEQKLADILQKYKDTIVIASRADLTPHPLCLYSHIQHGDVSKKQDALRTFQIGEVSYELKRVCPDNNIHEGNTQTIWIFARELLELYQKQTNPFDAKKIDTNLALFDTLGEKKPYIEYYTDGKKHRGTFWYQSYSFLDILQWKERDDSGNIIDLKGKIVLVGEVGTLIHDSQITPVDPYRKMPWVEINANILQTLMMWRVLIDASTLSHFLIFFCFFTLIGCSVFYVRSRIAFWILFLLILLCIIVGSIAYTQGYIFNIFMWILWCFLSFIFAYIYRFQITDKAKRILKKQFSLYVSPDIVEEMAKNPEQVLIRWEKKQMSIFFSDIVSFTNISENIAPEKMVLFLNEYFAEMTKIIHQNKGTLDKYIGDSVMCFFNAPISQENHSYFACMTALEQQKKLKELNEKWEKEWFPNIKIRIWLHTGEAVHGNIGSTDTRVSYTIIGDSVNLASRLEGVCKEYGIYICVSQQVYELQKDMFHFRELDTIAVKGKTQAIKIYQLLWPKTLQIPEKNQLLFQKYAQALEYYRAEKYSEAGQIWLQNGEDPTSIIMAQRCRDILDWKAQAVQGVFIMTHK
jgi:class 3 adenylate cyclase/CHASE2 domain-containing sensor protein